MTATTTRSARPADRLLTRARKLAADLGEVPSRNRLMTELKVGAPKARTLRATLLEEAGEPADAPDPDPGPDPGPAESEEPGPDPDPDPGSDLVPVDPAGPVQTRGSDRVPDLVPEPGPEPPTDPGPASLNPGPVRTRPAQVWPVLLLAVPAFVAIWSGWVGLGGLTGFGVVHPLPGIWDAAELDTAITLPIGMETYAAYALRVWLTPGLPARARTFARWSAIGSLCLGAAGQIAYHLMTAAHIDHAPWQITTLVACLPVAVLGMGAALAHLLRNP